MKSIKGLMAFLVLASFLFSCQSTPRPSWFDDNGKVKVLCTIAMISDLVEKIGGENIDCTTLVSEELDPHSYELVKGDDEKILRADVVFYNGLGLEHTPSLLHHLSHHRNSIALGDWILSQEEGDICFIEGQVDPHIWMDIALWTKIVDPLVDYLSAADPENAADYLVGGVQLKKEMLNEHNKVRETLSNIPEENRFLITSHDAFHYFTRAYLATDRERKDGSWNKRCAAPEGLAPDAQLTAGDVQEIVDHMERYGVRTLFTEANVSKDSIWKVLDASAHKGMEVSIASEPLYGDSLGPTKGDYLLMIRHNAEAIKANLR